MLILLAVLSTNYDSLYFQVKFTVICSVCASWISSGPVDFSRSALIFLRFRYLSTVPAPGGRGFLHVPYVFPVPPSWVSPSSVGLFRSASWVSSSISCLSPFQPPGFPPVPFVCVPFRSCVSSNVPCLVSPVSPRRFLQSLSVPVPPSWFPPVPFCSLPLLGFLQFRYLFPFRLLGFLQFVIFPVPPPGVSFSSVTFPVPPPWLLFCLVCVFHLFLIIGVLAIVYTVMPYCDLWTHIFHLAISVCSFIFFC